MSHAHDLAPSPWIVRFAPLVPSGATVLDLASGRGRHARFFAACGCKVVAVDRDAEALAALAEDSTIETRVADLETGEWPLGDAVFDAVVVANYLHRPLFPHLARAVAATGLVLYETFARGNEAFGRPSRPDFLLAPGELLRAFDALTPVAFEQGRVREQGREAVVQRLAAVGPSRPWPPALP